MSKVISNKGYIGMGKQSAQGTKSVTSDIFVKYIDEGFVTEFDTTPLREGGDDELIGCVVKNQHREKFQFTCRARPEITAYLYAYLMGDDTVSGASDPYTHVIKRGTERPWLTFRRKLDTSEIQALVDCKIESIQVEAEAGKSLMLTVEGSGLTAEMETAEETPSYEACQPFVFYHGSGAYKLETIVNNDIKKFTIKYTVKSQEGMQTDEILIGDLPDLQVDVDVSLEFYAEDVVMWQKANYNNTDAPAETLYSGAFEFDCKFTELVADDREFKLVVGKFVWSPVTGFNLKGEPEAISTVLAGIGTKPDSGELVEVTVKNDVATDLN